jgi:hypothetical protein
MTDSAIEPQRCAQKRVWQMTTNTYDLTQDWSNSANPNGPWSLLQGTTPLPFDANWTPLGGTTSLTPQPAWAPGNNFGDYLPAWFQATSVVSFLTNGEQFAVPLVVGDIYVHPTDYANGQQSGIANVQFTAPMAGVATISALLENVGITSRPQDWQLSVGGTVVSSGVVPLNATTYTLAGIGLSAGETVDLALFPDSNGLGTFVETDLSINLMAATFWDNFSPPSPLWSNSVGNWTASSGQYFAQNPNNSPLTYSGLPYDFTNSNLSVTVTVNALGDGGIWLDTDGTNQNGILLVLGGNGYGQGSRGATAGNEAYWHVVQNGSVNGGNEVVGSGVFTPGGTYTVTVLVNGDTYEAFKDPDGVYDANSVLSYDISQ